MFQPDTAIQQSTSDSTGIATIVKNTTTEKADFRVKQDSTQLVSERKPVVNNIGNNYSKPGYIQSPKEPNFLKLQLSTNHKDFFKQPVLIVPDSVKNESIQININSRFNSSQRLDNQFKDYTLMTMVLIIGFMAWMRVFYGKYLNQIFLSAINYHESERLFSSNNLLMARLNYTLNFIAIVSIGLNIAIVLFHYNLHFFDFQNLTLIVFSILLMLFYVIYKTVLSKTFGFLVLKTNMLNESLNSAFIYLKILAICTIPLNIFYFYGTPNIQFFLIYTSLVFMFVTLGLTFFRTIQIFIRNGFTIFYTMLYLCTVELFPILVVYKLIVR